MNIKYLFLFITAAFLMGGCSSDEPKGNPAEDETTPVEVSYEAPEVTIEKLELDAAEAQAAADIKKFGLDFFRAASAEMPGKNMVVSPLSASMLLSMIANVADEKTEAQITTALGTDNLEALNATSHKLMAWLPNVDKTVTVNLSNSIWYSYEHRLTDEFMEVALNNYLTDLYSRNFDQPAPVVKEINNWIDGKTSGMIKDAIPEGLITHQTISVLVNTLYFKGNWLEPFIKEETGKETFYGTAGESEVDMMYKTRSMKCAVSDNFKAVYLEFGDESTHRESFRLILALPKNKDISIDRAIETGELANLKFNDGHIILGLPRFEVKDDESILLDKIFASLGIDNLTNPQDCRIFTEPVEAFFKSFQKSNFKVDELGAEGASASFTLMAGSPGPEEPEYSELILNRPFAFMLVEKNTGVCLLAGKVTNL